MIEVTIKDDYGELGRIRIDHIDGTELADYTVEFAIDRHRAVGLHARSIRSFPRTKYNALALLKQALETLDPRELELERGTSASDLARRFRRVIPAFQARKS